MKHYPRIPHYNKGLFGQNCFSFNKLDGSSMRFEWNKKRGFYKFGTRNVMIDKSNSDFSEAIDIFLNKYSEDLNSIFTKKYKSVENFVVFGEFYGENSFAGKHIDSDKKDIKIFDISQYKRGIINPKEFLENFGDLDIPELVYRGIYSEEFIKEIKNSNLKEGVVCKGTFKVKGSEIVWMSKIKTKEWLSKVKSLYGDSAIIDEFNGDKNLYNLYEMSKR